MPRRLATTLRQLPGALEDALNPGFWQSSRRGLSGTKGTWSDGHQTRMVQVCIDSPAAAHDDEVAFWRALLPGRWVGSEAREFAGKWHDDAGSPVQLLFQRLDETHGSVRAHDHGTDDLTAEVHRLRGLGAADVAPGHGGWHVLRDTAGLAFCVTPHSPATARSARHVKSNIAAHVIRCAHSRPTDR
jgi:hypothetical protein